MIRFACLFAFAAAPAHAHPGHLAEVAGHGHWIGLGALAAGALLAGLLGKGRKEAEAEPEAEEAPEAEEQPA